jgi:hypothetical protein
MHGEITYKTTMPEVVINHLNPVKGAPSMRFSSANFLHQARVTRFTVTEIFLQKGTDLGLKKNLCWFSKA